MKISSGKSEKGIVKVHECKCVFKTNQVKDRNREKLNEKENQACRLFTDIFHF